jgi:Calcineurin-like phosphoesterase
MVRRAWLWPLLLAAACTDEAPDAAPGATAPPGPFTIVVLPDTQFYAQAYPEIFKAQVDWILGHREDERIAFVLHEGDIVNHDREEQWQVASASLHALDGKVPYVLAVGNHDLGWKEGRLVRDADLFNQHFPATDLAARPWPTGTFAPGRMENHYQVLDAAGARWLVLALEYGPRDAVVAWADEVLGRHADLPAIVLTHAYLSDIFGRYNRTNQQPFWPCRDLMDQDGCNDGEDLWQKLISRHDNVVFVFSGHVLHPGVGRLTSDHPSGRRTHQMLANYQTCGGLPCVNPQTGLETKGGDGFLRLVRVDPILRRALVESYSPYTDTQLTDDRQRFVLDLDGPPRAAGAALAPLRPPAVVAPPRPRGCDGLHVVLEGVEATGTPASARRVRACLDGACERFTIDPTTLACRPARPQSRISCVNEEGRLRLFFFAGLSARQKVAVSADDATGRAAYAVERMVPAHRAGGCWSALATLAR